MNTSQKSVTMYLLGSVISLIVHCREHVNKVLSKCISMNFTNVTSTNTVKYRDVLSLAQCLLLSKLYQTRGCFGGLLQGQKPVQLLCKIRGQVVRGSVCLHGGTQVWDELTAFLKLLKFLFVLLTYVVWVPAVKCCRGGKVEIFQVLT